MFDALLPVEQENETIPIERKETVATIQTTSTDNQANFDEELELKNELLEAVFIQSCYCSLGATLEADSRLVFDDFMKKTAGLMMVEDTPEKPATTSRLIKTLH